MNVHSVSKFPDNLGWKALGDVSFVPKVVAGSAKAPACDDDRCGNGKFPVPGPRPHLGVAESFARNWQSVSQQFRAL